MDLSEAVPPAPGSLGPPSEGPRVARLDLAGLEADQFQLGANFTRPAGQFGTAQLLLVALLISLILISIVGNCLVCVAIFTDRRLRKLGNAFVVSLAVADLFVSCLVMTFALCNDLMDHWIFGEWFCDVWISFDIMCCTASILNLCAISLDRFVHIKDCLLYNQWMSRNVALGAVGLIWFISALVSFVPINLGWHRPSHFKLVPMAGEPELDLLAARTELPPADGGPEPAAERWRRQTDSRLGRPPSRIATGQMARVAMEAVDHNGSRLNWLPAGNIPAHGGPTSAAATTTTATSATTTAIELAARGANQEASGSQSGAPSGSLPGRAATSTATTTTATAPKRRSTAPSGAKLNYSARRGRQPIENQSSGDGSIATMGRPKWAPVKLEAVNLFGPAPWTGAKLLPSGRLYANTSWPHSYSLPHSDFVSSNGSSSGPKLVAQRRPPSDEATKAATTAARRRRRAALQFNQAESNPGDAEAQIGARRTPVQARPGATSDGPLPQCALSLTPSYAVVSSAISFYIPCLVMLGLYSKLFACARRHVRNIRAISRAPQPIGPEWLQPAPELGPARTWIKFGSRRRPEAPEQGPADLKPNRCQPALEGEPFLGAAPPQANTTTATRVETAPLAGLQGSLTSQRSLAVRLRLSGGQQTGGGQASQQQTSQLATHKAAVTLGIIMGTFLFCWVPFFCINIIRAFCTDCVPTSAFRFFTWLGYANSALNPIIYGIHNSEFRNAFNRIFFKHLSMKSGRQYLSRRLSYDLRHHNQRHNHHHNHNNSHHGRRPDVRLQRPDSNSTATNNSQSQSQSQNQDPNPSPSQHQLQQQQQQQQQQQPDEEDENRTPISNQKSLTTVGQTSETAESGEQLPEGCRAVARGQLPAEPRPAL